MEVSPAAVIIVMKTRDEHRAIDLNRPSLR